MDKVGVRRVLRAAFFAGMNCAAGLHCAPSHRFAVTAAHVTDLGTLGGAQSAARDINDSGQIVGWAATAQGLRHAFRFSNGTMSDIGSVFGNADSEATGINAGGIVAGTLTDQAGSVGFVLNGSAATSLFPPTVLLPPFNSTHAAAINDAGEACGGGSASFPIFWFNTAQGAQLAGNGEARDLNAFGVVVGNGNGKGQVWTFKTCRITPNQACAQDVPLPNPPASYGPVYDSFAINDRGEVVGDVTLTAGVSSPVSRAYFWNGGLSSPSVELGVLPTGSKSHAEDINELGFIAGHADERTLSSPPIFNVTRERAFLFHRDFGLFALPVLSATTALGSCRATALNERQSSTGLVQLVGLCDVPGGTHAVRWDVTVASVPIVGGHP